MQTWATRVLNGSTEQCPDKRFRTGHQLQCPYAGTMYNATLHDFWQPHRGQGSPAILVDLSGQQAVISFDVCTGRFVWLKEDLVGLSCTCYTTLADLWDKHLETDIGT